MAENLVRAARTADELAFRVIDGRVGRWIIPVPAVESDTPDEPRQREGDERPAPTDSADQVGGDGRRDGAADECHGGDEPLRRPTPLRREPTRQHPGRLRGPPRPPRPPPEPP